MKSMSVWLLVVIGCPVILFASVKWYQSRFTRLPVLVHPLHRVADFRLLDQQGDAGTRKHWEQRIVVADFFFTHCPVVCPKMTRSLKEVQRTFAGDSTLLIASFSVDPDRDSVPRLQQYALRMDISGNWKLYTGNKKEIYHLARNSFKVVATDGDGGPGDFIHSELLVLVDKQQRIRGYYNGTDPAEVSVLLRDVRRLQRE